MGGVQGVALLGLFPSPDGKHVKTQPVTLPSWRTNVISSLIIHPFWEHPVLKVVEIEILCHS